MCVRCSENWQTLWFEHVECKNKDDLCQRAEMWW